MIARLRYQRIVVCIMDSVGCGTQPDYREFHARRANPLASVYAANEPLSLPNLEALGLRSTFARKNHHTGVSGKMRQVSQGNDTFAGVWSGPLSLDTNLVC